MQIQITGAKIDQIGRKFYVLYQDQVVGCFRDKIDAFSLALDSQAMTKMLRKYNTTNSKFFLTKGV